MGQSEEIKSKLDIVEVIREYVPVKAVGANFQAVCPFHNEKTPSFIISPDKQIWHCFGCSRGGDVFAFVMEKENLNFIEALRLLANKAGVVLKYEKSDNYAKRNRVLDILELSGKYYNHVLSTPVGGQAQDYLLKRGLESETIKEWQLGYSPDAWDNLYRFLRERPLSGPKYTDEEILAAGLIIKKEGGRSYYDRFRDRLMFPIWDVNNNLIAFTARVNPAKEKTEKMGKYINSPQTGVYDKSKVLFALNKAKNQIRQDDLAIVVEGQMDVIACHKHGFKNVIASSGTALTVDQITLVKRYTKNIALLFDMDDAGQLAADRGIKEVLAQELNLKIIILSGYKDPDECLNKNPDDFKRAISEAKPMLDYYFDKISANLDLEQLDNKRLVRDKMFTMISLVSNKTEQGYWLKKLSEELNFYELDTREEFAKWQAKISVLKDKETRKNNQLAGHNLPSELSREDKLAELLLAILLKFPELINYSASNLEPDYLNTELAKFYKEFIIHYNRSNTLDYENFRLYLEENYPGDENFLDKLILLGEKEFYNYDYTQIKSELSGIISELKKYGKQRKIQQLQRAIAIAEKNGQAEELGLLMNDLKNLMIS
ncbi:MAG: DNA primase [Patescibacteria group bacterium]